MFTHQNKTTTVSIVEAVLLSVLVIGTITLCYYNHKTNKNCLFSIILIHIKEFYKTNKKTQNTARNNYESSESTVPNNGVVATNHSTRFIYADCFQLFSAALASVQYSNPDTNISNMFMFFQPPVIQHIKLVHSSSHVTLSLTAEDTHKIRICCLLNNKCIIPSKFYHTSNIYELSKFDEESNTVCTNCAIFFMVKTNNFQTTLDFIHGPLVKQREKSIDKLGLMWISRIHLIISQSIISHPYIHLHVWKNKQILKTLFRIFFVPGSCLNILNKPRFHPSCTVVNCLLYLIKYGYNRKLLKWFIIANKGMYFKILILDLFQHKINSKQLNDDSEF
eukprot:117810_1